MVANATLPNSGKTTLFNDLTGSNQYVGNWPGVTVEKKDGPLKGRKDVTIQDLPGIYSLSPCSLEERVSRKYLVEERPDAILDIVDGTNIERNLYLTTQLAELGLPMVVAANMVDLVAQAGDKIDFVRFVVAVGPLGNDGLSTQSQFRFPVGSGARNMDGCGVLAGGSLVSESPCHGSALGAALQNRVAEPENVAGFRCAGAGRLRCGAVLADEVATGHLETFFADESLAHVGGHDVFGGLDAVAGNQRRGVVAPEKGRGTPLRRMADGHGASVRVGIALVRVGAQCNGPAALP